MTAREETYDVSFNYRRLKADMKLDIPELPKLFKQHLNIKLTKSGIYAWFERGRMPIKRLTQLMTIVLIESGNKTRLNIWDYIEATKQEGRKPKKAA